jgi:hypothetical protein
MDPITLRPVWPSRNGPKRELGILQSSRLLHFCVFLVAANLLIMLRESASNEPL